MTTLEQRMFRDFYHCHLMAWIRHVAESSGPQRADACLEAMADVLGVYGHGSSYERQQEIEKMFEE